MSDPAAVSVPVPTAAAAVSCTGVHTHHHDSPIKPTSQGTKHVAPGTSGPVLTGFSPARRKHAGTCAVCHETGGKHADGCNAASLQIDAPRLVQPVSQKFAAAACASCRAVEPVMDLYINGTMLCSECSVDVGVASTKQFTNWDRFSVQVGGKVFPFNTQDAPVTARRVDMSPVFGKGIGVDAAHQAIRHACLQFAVDGALPDQYRKLACVSCGYAEPVMHCIPTKTKANALLCTQCKPSSTLETKGTFDKWGAFKIKTPYAEPVAFSDVKRFVLNPRVFVGIVPRCSSCLVVPDNPSHFEGNVVLCDRCKSVLGVEAVTDSIQCTSQQQPVFTDESLEVLAARIILERMTLPRLPMIEPLGPSCFTDTEDAAVKTKKSKTKKKNKDELARKILDAKILDAKKQKKQKANKIKTTKKTKTTKDGVQAQAVDTAKRVKKTFTTNKAPRGPKGIKRLRDEDDEFEMRVARASKSIKMIDRSGFMRCVVKEIADRFFDGPPEFCFEEENGQVIEWDKQKFADEYILDQVMNPTTDCPLFAESFGNDWDHFMRMAQFGQDKAVSELPVPVKARLPSTYNRFFREDDQPWSITSKIPSESYGRVLHWVYFCGHFDEERAAQVQTLLGIKTETLQFVASRYEMFDATVRKFDKSHPPLREPVLEPMAVCGPFDDAEKCVLCEEDLSGKTNDERAEHIAFCSSVEVRHCPAVHCPVTYQSWFHKVHIAECPFYRTEMISGVKGRRPEIHCPLCKVKGQYAKIREHIMNDCTSPEAEMVRLARKSVRKNKPCCA